MLNDTQKMLVTEAIDLIIEAQAMVDEAVSGTSEESRYLSYARFGFDTLLNNGNPHNDGLADLLKDEE